VNLDTRHETFERIGSGSVREKDEEAVVECERKVILVYRRMSMMIPLGILTTRRQYRVVSISILDTHTHRAGASCHEQDSNPYGRDGLAHSRSLSTARRALRVA